MHTRDAHWTGDASPPRVALPSGWFWRAPGYAVCSGKAPHYAAVCQVVYHVERGEAIAYVKQHGDVPMSVVLACCETRAAPPVVYPEFGETRT